MSYRQKYGKMKGSHAGSSKTYVQKGMHAFEAGKKLMPVKGFSIFKDHKIIRPQIMKEIIIALIISIAWLSLVFFALHLIAKANP